MKIYIIGPVRDVEEWMLRKMSAYVQGREYDGHSVYWSHRDTHQDDPTGYQICQDNLAAIQACDRVDVFWTDTSRGSLFDLGIAWALRKKLKLVEEFTEPTDGKCFQRVLQEWEEEPPVDPTRVMGCLQKCESKEDLYTKAQCKLMCLAEQFETNMKELRKVKAELAELKRKKSGNG